MLDPLNTEIRFYQEIDSEGVIKLTQDLAEFHGERSVLTKEFLDHAVGACGFYLIVACKDNKVVGYVSAYHRIALVNQSDFIFIDHLVVDAQHRRERLGKKLVLCLAREGDKKGATGVSLSFRGSNTTAYGFYKKIGFEIQERQQGEYRAVLTDRALKDFMKQEIPL